MLDQKLGFQAQEKSVSPKIGIFVHCLIHIFPLCAKVLPRTIILLEPIYQNSKFYQDISVEDMTVYEPLCYLGSHHKCLLYCTRGLLAPSRKYDKASL